MCFIKLYFGAVHAIIHSLSNGVVEETMNFSYKIKAGWATTLFCWGEFVFQA